MASHTVLPFNPPPRSTRTIETQFRPGRHAAPPSPTAGGRSLRSVAGTVLAACLVLSGVVLTTSTAHATPTVAEIEAQIDKAWRELEPTIEKHNATRIELGERKKEAEKLAEKIAPLQRRADLAMAEISDLAAHAYKTGNMSGLSALLSSGSPTTFVDQIAMLDQFAKSQRERLEAVLEVKGEYEAEKVELDAIVAELSELEASQEAKREKIDAEIKRLQALRLQAYGSSNSTGNLRPAACPTAYPGGSAGTVISFACAQIGKPYIWAAAGPDGYDCSGLVLAAWRQVGVNLPHNAAQQRNAVRYIERSDLIPGDLVFYYSDLSHVAMYAGDGWIVHAPGAGRQLLMQRMDHASIHSFGRPG